MPTLMETRVPDKGIHVHKYVILATLYENEVNGVCKSLEQRAYVSWQH